MQLQERTFSMRGNRIFPALGPLRLIVTDNGDGTLALAWTDLVTRTEGYYSILENGAEVETIAFDDPFTYAAEITAPLDASRWQVKYVDGSDVVRRQSNIWTIPAREPWEFPVVIDWLDAEPDVRQTVQAFRYDRSAVQYHSTPHIPEFDGASNASLMFWRAQEYGADPDIVGDATDATGFMGQGGVLPAWFFAGDGFNFRTGPTGASGASILTNVANTTYSQAIVSVPETERIGSCHIWTFENGVSRFWIDGVEHEPDYEDLDGVLPSGSAEFRIGSGYRTGNYAWNCAAGADRTWTEAEVLALSQARLRHVRYAELAEEVGEDFTDNLLFWFEDADLNCKHTDKVLTPVNGPTTIEIAWQITDRANGKVYENIVGRGVRINDTGVFKSGRAAYINECYAPTLPALSNAGLVCTTAPLAWPTVGGHLIQIRSHSVAYDEAFAAIVTDNQLGTAYAGPMYGLYLGGKHASYRLRNSPTFDGGHVSDFIVANDTNYIFNWDWPGDKSMGLTVNGTPANIVANPGAYDPSDVTGQALGATGLFGQTSWRATVGTTFRLNGIPSDTLLAAIVERISD